MSFVFVRATKSSLAFLSPSSMTPTLSHPRRARARKVLVVKEVVLREKFQNCRVNFCGVLGCDNKNGATLINVHVLLCAALSERTARNDERER